MTVGNVAGVACSTLLPVGLGLVDGGRDPVARVARGPDLEGAGRPAVHLA